MNTITSQTELWCKTRKSFTLMVEKSNSDRGAAGSVDRGRMLRKVGKKPGQCGVMKVKEKEQGKRN